MTLPEVRLKLATLGSLPTEPLHPTRNELYFLDSHESMNVMGSVQSKLSFV